MNYKAEIKKMFETGTMTYKDINFYHLTYNNFNYLDELEEFLKENETTNPISTPNKRGEYGNLTIKQIFTENPYSCKMYSSEKENKKCEKEIENQKNRIVKMIESSQKIETKKKKTLLKEIDGQKYIELSFGKTLKQIKETEKAICLVRENETIPCHSTLSSKKYNDYIWLPKSQIIEEKENNLIYVKQWLFNKKF